MVRFLINALGILVYMAVGLGFMWLTNRHISNLEAKVAEIDIRYSKRLFGKWITVKDTKVNRIIVDILTMIFWPIMVIASVLKAEWEYDTIVNHSAFTKKNGSRY